MDQSEFNLKTTMKKIVNKLRYINQTFSKSKKNSSSMLFKCLPICLFIFVVTLTLVREDVSARTFYYNYVIWLTFGFFRFITILVIIYAIWSDLHKMPIPRLCFQVIFHRFDAIISTCKCCIPCLLLIQAHAHYNFSYFQYKVITLFIGFELLKKKVVLA